MSDLELAKLALRKPCRYHAPNKAATCTDCYDAALEQQAQQWARQRRAAHKRYLEGA